MNPPQLNRNVMQVDDGLYSAANIYVYINIIYKAPQTICFINQMSGVLKTICIDIISAE